MTKTLYTLNVNDYDKRITELTYPLLKHYARKIGAELVVINERRWPEFPPVYEKLQIFQLGAGSEWNIFFDSDALVHPDLFDVTDYLPRDTVMHNGADMAGHRWTYDEYFRRDGRHIGSCNWFAVGSNWCLDLWHPLEDLTLDQALERIHPIVLELKSGVITRDHLIDDHVLSRNIARYGVKFTTFMDVMEKNPRLKGNYLWHEYVISADEKVSAMRKVLAEWGI